VLAAALGTAAVAAPPSGALVDRFRAKPILVAGSLASGLGYAGFAFVDRPWQAFVCSAVGGAGLGVTNIANRVLSLTLVTAEQHASLIALGRVAGNFGIGSGATVAGFIVASAQHLRAFQALCFRAVARDRLFLILIAANIVLMAVGPSLFANILPPFATAHTPVGPSEIGVLSFLNTFFIVVAQIPSCPAHLCRARTTPSARPLHVALQPHLHGSPGPRPRSQGAVLAMSPDAVWWGGALTAALIGAACCDSTTGYPTRLADAMRSAASGTGGDVTRPRWRGSSNTPLVDRFRGVQRHLRAEVHRVKSVRTSGGRTSSPACGSRSRSSPRASKRVAGMDQSATAPDELWPDSTR
jgi:MFS family permease